MRKDDRKRKDKDNDTGSSITNVEDDRKRGKDDRKRNDGGAQPHLQAPSKWRQGMARFNCTKPRQRKDTGSSITNVEDDRWGAGGQMGSRNDR